jgi:hypothetical protein
MVESANIFLREWWLILILLIILAMIWLEQPRRLWRSFAAYSSRTPMPFVAVFSIVAFVALNATVYHLEGTIENTTRQLTDDNSYSTLVHSFGFLWEGWTANAESRTHWIAFLTMGLVFGICAMLLFRLRYSIFELDIEEKDPQQSPPRRVIVMGLSELEGEYDENITEFSALNLDDAVNRVSRFQWQQNLRIIHHHLRTPLKRSRLFKLFRRRPNQEFERQYVIILPSEESEKQAEKFLNMVQSCLANSGYHERMSMTVWSRAVDYSSLNDLKNAFRDIIADVVGSSEIAAKDYDISIDTTPGKKVPSIAAAAATFANRAEFTYVDANRSGWRIAAFDVIARFRAPSNP